MSIDKITEVMGRLGRVISGEKQRDVYGTASGPQTRDAMRKDEVLLLKFAAVSLPGIVKAYQDHIRHAERCNFQGCGCEFCQPINKAVRTDEHAMPTAFAVR